MKNLKTSFEIDSEEITLLKIKEKINTLSNINQENNSSCLYYMQNLSDEKLQKIKNENSEEKLLKNEISNIHLFYYLVANELMEDRNFKSDIFYKNIKARKKSTLNIIKNKYPKLVDKFLDLQNDESTLKNRFREIVYPFYFDKSERLEFLSNCKQFFNEIKSNIEFSEEDLKNENNINSKEHFEEWLQHNNNVHAISYYVYQIYKVRTNISNLVNKIKFPYVFKPFINPKIDSIITYYNEEKLLNNEFENIYTFVHIVASELLSNKKFKPYSFYNNIIDKKSDEIAIIQNKYPNLKHKIEEMVNDEAILQMEFKDLMLIFYFDTDEQIQVKIYIYSFLNNINNMEKYI